MLKAMLAGATALASTMSFALAQEAQVAAADAGEEVIVFGEGQSRQVQSVKGNELALKAPGASPLKLVEKLPNVNIQSADPFGSYEWSARITIRGFSQSYLGFSLDDIPLGDMTYGNHNGLHISRAIASENVGSVELAQGAGSLDTASSSNLGGTLKFLSRDPQEEMGGLAALTYGSDETFRGFLRFETGRFDSGTSAYVSYLYADADKWKGDGQQRQQQVNFKLVQEIGEAKISALVNWSSRQEQDYQDLSLGMIGRLGYHWDNLTSDYDFAVLVAEIANNRGDTGVAGVRPGLGTTYPAPVETADDGYYDASGLRDDWIYALKFDVPFGESVDFNATVYGHEDEGQGLWGTPYVPSPNYGIPGATVDNSPISIRTTEYELQRYGIVAGLTIHAGDHTINGGVWYENNDFTQARRFYALDYDAPGRSFLDMQRDPFFTQWEYDFHTTTWQFHIQDTWEVTERLTINAGFKSLKVENEAVTVTGANKTGTIEAEENFLPQVGLLYDIDDSTQVFASYARNMRAFPSSGTSGPFSASQAGFEAIRDSLEPETSDTYELGLRYRSGSFRGLVALFHVDFHDRLFAVPVGSGIQGNPSALGNVGGVSIQGVEVAADWAISDDWSLFASYAFNDSEYQDDTFDGDGNLVAYTEGKTVVDTPEHLFKAQLRYDDGSWFGQVSMNYMSARFFTYENDQKVPSQTLFEVSAGYRVSDETSILEGFEAQVTVTNLFDEQFVSTINSNGFPIRGDSQTLLAGAPQQIFLTLRKTF